MEDYTTIEEIEELKKLVPIDLLTEKERMYAVELSKNDYPQVVKYIHQAHPKEISIKFAKIYYDLYIKNNSYEG